ncbi:MAG: hypothetical protein KF730_08545 [Sphingomonas sp.]|uniref:hypothetical protein n=1 Tax=Sphingomonas sp. TaxID=28214 RepID=UPI0025E0975B|nr:hypothetical protein [Sphingomonas sp.]MBX3564608.1 hypothetical protein [Sphingomonas sp.]
MEMMRSAFTAALLIATPATAQRLDTRRVDVRDSADATTCTYKAYPALGLVDGSKAGKGKVAMWSAAPDDFNGPKTDLPDARDRLEFIFGPSDDWRKPATIGIGATLYPDAQVARDEVGGATLRFDGMPVTTSFNASGDKMIFAATRDLDGLGALLLDTREMSIDVENKAGHIVRSYYWDVHRLRDGAETVSVTKWSCTTP